MQKQGGFRDTALGELLGHLAASVAVRSLRLRVVIPVKLLLCRWEGRELETAIKTIDSPVNPCSCPVSTLFPPSPVPPGKDQMPSPFPKICPTLAAGGSGQH